MSRRSTCLVLASCALLVAGARGQTCDFRLADYVPSIDQGGAGCIDGTGLRRLQSIWLNDCMSAPGPYAPYDVTILWYQDSDGDGAWSAGDAEVVRGEFPDLYWPPGRVSDFAPLAPLPLPEPTLPLWVIIDPDDAIPETDESNNAVLVGYPCAADSARTIPMSDLLVCPVNIEYRTTGLPPGDAIATVDARLTNGGATDPAIVVPVLAWCATSPPQVLDVLAPPAGAFTDFTFEMPFSGVDTLTLEADWTGGSNPPPGLVAECDEENNRSRATLDPSTSVMSRAMPVGAALRAAGHSSPGPSATAVEFEWLRDDGAPRPAGDSFVIFASMSASRLDPVPMDPPLLEPRWTLVTPRGTAERTLHFVLVAAADEDGRLAE